MSEEANNTIGVPEETLRGAWNTATEKFQEGLERNAFAKEYLARRGISDETIHEAKIGYAPDNWHFLANQGFVEEQGYSLDTLVQAGLVIRKEPGEEFSTPKYFDRFRNRIVIPISDSQGRIISATARTLDPEERAKYLNGPETPIYKKGEVLFGLPEARRHIAETGRAIIFEGAMDVLQGRQHEIRNVVAPCGTALTPKQVDLLDRFGNIEKIWLADNDENGAGVKAAERICEQLLGRDLKIAVPWELGDPDDILRHKRGKAMLLAYIDGAEGALSFLVNRKLEARRKSLSRLCAEDKSVLMAELKEPLKRVPDVRRGIYMTELAEMLKLQPSDVGDFVQPYSATSPVPNRGSRFWQHQLVRIVFALASRPENRNGSLEHIFEQCDHLEIPKLLDSEPRAVFNYLRKNSRSMRLEELDIPLFREPAVQTISRQIASQSGREEQLDAGIIGSLMNTSLIAYPIGERQTLNHALFEQAVFELHNLAIADHLRHNFRRRKISLEAISKLSDKVKRGEINGTATK